MIFWDSINTQWNGDGTPNKQRCWEWRSVAGTGKRGYTHYQNKSWSTSRLAWVLTYGEIPEGMCVCHRCDNPPCCNPYHLFLGTIQDNVDDREAKGRNKMPHSKGEEHGSHKLTQEEVMCIRNLYFSSAHTYRSLAEMFGVTFGAIRNIIKRKTWSWLE